ncbi:DUF6785 family protein [Phycisphaera mikurensis]|uniref:Uncharacterized protein n=1 Tax=Phycisphaera mikurensis (strain NBRC 102666 / KCTC 22515 / FYK2301M01) TaxID=1142394 RepID=I0IAG3_PHYMF|nr:DUF6785 family protein [Phycisphaera mikurensis]MBB6441752.1 hypothetical protein [Phycisphaera mikurensis]BAM02251.1 hypothetical protein PSMK_00920 [Phycisphaera mikurensis NBRC 102666]
MPHPPPDPDPETAPRRPRRRSLRAVVLGLGLALFVAGFTYFNDAVVRQTPFIGNFLPVSVFGVTLAAALGLNPLLSWLGRGRAWPRALRPLKPVELGVVAALALGACGWAGSGYFRTFLTVLVVPGDQVRANPGWSAAGVMSYVPGGDAALAPGQVRGLAGVAAAGGVAAARSADPAAGAGVDPASSLAAALGLLPDLPAAGPAAAAVAAQLTAEEAAFLASLAGQASASGTDTAEALRALNRLIENPGWVESVPPPLRPAGTHAALSAAGALEAERSRLLGAQAELLARRARVAPAPAEDPDAARAAAGLQARLESLRAAGRSIEEPGGRGGSLRAARELAARELLAAALPAHVAPPPRGGAVLPAGGRPDPWITDAALAGRPAAPGAGWGLGELPWPLWVPVLLRWGGATLLLAAMGLGLALVVHPQWTRRELLPYPIARLLEEAAAPDPLRGGAGAPAVLRRGVFWAGFALVAGVHLLGGLHAWFPAVPAVPLGFDLNPLRSLFPVASAVPGADGVFNARLYPAVAAFACFLTLPVGFSLGVSMLLWLALGAAFLGSGAAFTDGFYGPGSGNLLRAGAYAAMSMVVLYTGRRFYAAAAVRGVGLGGLLPGGGAGVPASAVWGARVAALGGLAAAAVLRDLGLAAPLALGFVVAVAAVWVVMSRVVAETGCFYLQPGFLPVGIASGLLGDAALGPVGLVLVGLASLLVIGDQRETLMPFLLHALRLGDPAPGRVGVGAPAVGDAAGSRGVGKLAAWLALSVASTFVLALVVTFLWQYNAGIDAADRWARLWMPVQPWDQLTRSLSSLSAEGRLTEAVFTDGLARLGLLDPRPAAWSWFLGGFAALSICALLRLRIPGWPLHPVIFLVWGTTPMSRFAWSFLVGWLVKLCVVRLGGTRAARSMQPLLVGVIAAELLMALGWIAVGAAYHLATGKTPAGYVVFPG